MHEPAQLLLADPLAVLEHDRRADLLAQLGVRDAEDGRLAYGRMLVEHLLDLARIDVVAAADDQVLLAVDDEEVAVLVDPCHVARDEPAVVGDRLGGRVGPLPVAVHHVVPTDLDLADLALSDGSPSSSTTRISTPSIGVPIEPGLRSRSGWLKEATGEVSERP